MLTRGWLADVDAGRRGWLGGAEDAVHAAERARDSAERSATARVHEAETRCQEAVAGRALLDQELLTRAARADAEAGDAKLKLQEVRWSPGVLAFWLLASVGACWR